MFAYNDFVMPSCPDEIEQNNYNFWLKCVENNMNIICISEIPLFSTY